MIKVFYGTDRVRAQAAIRQFLGGSEYEVIDAKDLTAEDLPSIFFGKTLFDTGPRRIMLRDFTENSVVYSELSKFLKTPHFVALFENKIDKRAAAYAELKDKIEFLEFKLPERNFSEVYNIYKIAKVDGARAVSNLRKIEPSEDPIMFVGLLASQALKDYKARAGVSEKRRLKMIAEVDLQLKSTSVEPWLLVEALIIRLA